MFDLQKEYAPQTSPHAQNGNHFGLQKRKTVRDQRLPKEAPLHLRSFPHRERG